MNSVVSMDQGIPEALKKLHASREFNPPDPGSLSWVVTGHSGKGKTTLLTSFPNAAYLDMEGGAFMVPVRKAWCIYCPVLTDSELTPQLKNPPPNSKKPPAVSINSATQTLLDMAKKPDNPVHTVVIDSAELLQGILTAKLEKVWGESAGDRGQSAWRDINRAGALFIRQFQEVGYGVAIIVHLKHEFKDMKSGTTVFTKPTITDGFMETLKKFTDFTLTIGTTQRMNPETKKSELQYDVTTEQNIQKKGNYDLKKRIALSPVIQNVGIGDGMSKVFEDYWAAVDRIRKQFNIPVPAQQSAA